MYNKVEVEIQIVDYTQNFSRMYLRKLNVSLMWNRPTNLKFVLSMERTFMNSIKSLQNYDYILAQNMCKMKLKCWHLKV